MLGLHHRVMLSALLMVMLAMLPMAAHAQPDQCMHTVRSGETLYRIAREYGLSVSDLQKANAISNPNLIYVGQALTIPAEGCAALPDTSTPPGDSRAPLFNAEYTVQRGDTFSKIASLFDIPVEELLKANGFTGMSLLIPGRVIKIPQYARYQPMQVVYGPSLPPKPNQPVSTCKPGAHQINCYPKFGGQFWNYGSINEEPIITQWAPCPPEGLNGSGTAACSKTGLGYFNIPPTP